MLKAKILFLVLLAGLVSGCNPGGSPGETQAETEAQKKLAAELAQLKAQQVKDKALIKELGNKKPGELTDAQKALLAEADKNAQRIKALEGELKTVQGELQTQKEQAGKDAAAAQAALELAQKDANEAKGKLQTAETEKEQAAKDVLAKEKAQKEAQDELTAAEAESPQKPERVAAAKEAVSKTGGALTLAQAENTKKQEALAAAQKANEDKDKALQASKDEAAKKDAKIAELEAQIRADKAASDLALALKLEDLIKDANALEANAVKLKQEEEAAAQKLLANTNAAEIDRLTKEAAAAKERAQNAQKLADAAKVASEAKARAAEVEKKKEELAKLTDQAKKEAEERAKKSGKERLDLEIAARGSMDAKARGAAAEFLASQQALKTAQDAEDAASKNHAKLIKATEAADKALADAMAKKAEYAKKPATDKPLLSFKTYGQLIGSLDVEIDNPTQGLKVKAANAKKASDQSQKELEVLKAKTLAAGEFNSRVKSIKDAADHLLSEQGNLIGRLQTGVMTDNSKNYPEDLKNINSGIDNLKTLALDTDMEGYYAMRYNDVPSLASSSLKTEDAIEQLIDGLNTLKANYNNFVFVKESTFPGFVTTLSWAWKKAGYKPQPIKITKKAYLLDFARPATGLFLGSDLIKVEVIDNLDAALKPRAQALLKAYTDALRAYIAQVIALVEAPAPGLRAGSAGEKLAYDRKTGLFKVNGIDFNIFATFTTKVIEPDFFAADKAKVTTLAPYTVSLNTLMDGTNEDVREALVQALENTLVIDPGKASAYTPADLITRNEAIFNAFINRMDYVYALSISLPGLEKTFADLTKGLTDAIEKIRKTLIDDRGAMGK